MKELQRKQRLRRILYSMPSLIILLILTGFLVKGAFVMLDKKWESEVKAKELQDKALALAIREIEVENEIESLKTKEGVEAEIRERFGVTRGEERVAVIVDEKREATSTDEEAKPWYKKLWAAIIP